MGKIAEDPKGRDVSEDLLKQSGNTGRDLFLNDRCGFRNVEVFLPDVTHHPHLLHFGSG